MQIKNISNNVVSFYFKSDLYNLAKGESITLDDRFLPELKTIVDGNKNLSLEMEDYTILSDAFDQYLDDNPVTPNLSNYYTKHEVDDALAGLRDFKASETLHVSKNGSDTNVGSEDAPFLTIAAALDAVTDASPTKRYIIKVSTGLYTETSVMLKSNVFILGEDSSVTRISGACTLASDFSGSADNRSGFSRLTLISACDFDWEAVTSAAGKLYFQNVNFNSTVSLKGYNNGIAQAQFWNTMHFGNFTVSGINMLTVATRMGNVFMNQHPLLPTIWDGNGGSLGFLTMTTTINNFNQRCSMFAKSLFLDNVLVDGPVSYCDYTVSSLGLNNSTSNGGQLIPMNPTPSVGANTSLSNLVFPTAVNQPIIPANTNATNFGDWGKQWNWSFGYVHASTGTDLFLISYGSSFGADSLGKNIGIIADGAGLQPDVDGGNVSISTAATSGSGVRGKITLNAREIDVTDKKITNLQDGVDEKDAVNKGQLDSAIASVSSISLQVAKGSQVVGSELAYIDLDREYSMLLSVSVGRISVHEGEDYELSVVGGVTRLTWINSLSNPDGEEKIEEGDKVFWSGTY
jgi:hypothetical protein